MFKNVIDGPGCHFGHVNLIIFRLSHLTDTPGAKLELSKKKFNQFYREIGVCNFEFPYIIFTLKPPLVEN